MNSSGCSVHKTYIKVVTKSLINSAAASVPFKMADNSQGSNSNGLPSPSLPGGDSVLQNATGQYYFNSVKLPRPV